MSEKDPSSHEIPLKQALSERYLAYALSTIMARSLPDVRDGLKPVHRRLIYAMQQLHLDPNSKFKKSARVVGDVMGKFHPHGDAAIYDALVRLAQDFSVRYPLIEGQGNFGTIDGDNAAAMRYTEARLTPIASLLLRELEDGAVDFKSTYDGEAEEPVVFPSAFPNLLANGATGIAVGMATNIPPHNAVEICHALEYLIDSPDATTQEILKHLPAPDFPTGGVLVEDSSQIEKAYASGRGSFRLRAKWEVEPQKGGLYKIVITEIPYQVTKSKLVERIATLIIEKKIPLLADVMDESADDIRLVLEPKNRQVDPEVLMEWMFKYTDLEVRIPLNMNVLDHTCRPRVMSLKDVLQAFLSHRKEVLIRSSKHRLNVIDKRLELLDGFLIAYLHLDEVIRIIREEDDPKLELITRFALNEIQAEAILNMRLRTLRKIQEIEIRKEHQELSLEKENLNVLISDEKRQWQRIKSDFKSLRKMLNQQTAWSQRRTQIAFPPEPVNLEETLTVEIEEVTLVCSKQEWIRSFKGHLIKAEEIKYKEGDEERFILRGTTVDKLVIFATNGRAYTLPIDKIPSGRSQGEALRHLIDLESDHEIINLLLITPNTTQDYLVVSSNGRGFIVGTSDLLSQTKGGKQILVSDAGEKVFQMASIHADTMAIIGENRKLLVFPIKDIPKMSKGKGVVLQKYRDGKLSDFVIFNLEEGLFWIKNNKRYQEKDIWMWKGRRGGIGRLAPIGFPRDNKFASNK